MIIYMDEIEIEPQRNLVPSRDLGLSQVPNRVSMEDPPSDSQTSYNAA